MNPQIISDATFDQEVLKSNIPVLVDFWAEWCQPCKMVSPIVQEIAELYKGKLKVSKMNVDENPQIPGTLGIMSIPTLIFFKGGKPQKTLVGVQPKDAFLRAAEEVLSS